MLGNGSASIICLGFWGFRPPIQGVNCKTIKLCTETLFQAIILYQTLLSQPYTQVQGSIFTSIFLNIPQGHTRGGSNLWDPLGLP